MWLHLLQRALHLPNTMGSKFICQINVLAFKTERSNLEWTVVNFENALILITNRNVRTFHSKMQWCKFIYSFREGIHKCLSKIHKHSVYNLGYKFLNMTRCALSCKDASSLGACHWAIQCLGEDTVGRHDCSLYVRTFVYRRITYLFAKSYFKLHYTKLLWIQLVCTKFYFLPSIFWLIHQSLVSFHSWGVLPQTHTHLQHYIFTAGGSQTLYILAKTHMVIFTKKLSQRQQMRQEEISLTRHFLLFNK